MSENIVSKRLIAEQADAAAARWALHPTAEKPTNPYSIATAPEAHAEFKRQLEIALVKHTAPKEQGAAQ